MDFNEVRNLTGRESHLIGDDFYYGRNGREKNWEMAFRLWWHGANLGALECHKTLAAAYRDGIGCDVDRRTSMAWKQSAETLTSLRSRLRKITPNTLGIASMFKNEEHIMEEWVLHHREEGVTEFLLLDNGSDDDSAELARQLDCSVIYCPKRHAQEKMLSLYASRDNLLSSDWVMLIDLDEFVYARSGYETLPDYLATLDRDIDGVRMTFKMFGSSNQVYQPDSVVEHYIRRGVDNVDLPPPQKWNYKTIFRNRADVDVPRQLFAHAPEVLGVTIYPNDDKTVVTNGRQYCPRGSELREEDKFINLNHYSVQSREHFMRVRATRGDVNIRGWEQSGLRDLSFFKARDFRDLEDKELIEKRGEYWSEKFKNSRTELEGDGIVAPDKLHVFCYWDAGIKNMPEILQNVFFHNRMMCKKHNLKIHLLTEKNVWQYIDFDDRFHKLESNHQSDYVRWHLIHKYGGMWIDTDIILLKDIQPLIEGINEKEMAVNLEFNFTNDGAKRQPDMEVLVKVSDTDLDARADYLKLGCCVIFGRPNTEVSQSALNHMEEHLGTVEFDAVEAGEKVSYDALKWTKIGPVVCTALYRQFYSKINLLGYGEEDPDGWNAVNWKVDKLASFTSDNRPGINKKEWIGEPEWAKEKAETIMANPDCSYISIWSIYNQNDIVGDICDFVFHNPKSIFSYLVM